MPLAIIFYHHAKYLKVLMVSFRGNDPKPCILATDPRLSFSPNSGDFIGTLQIPLKTKRKNDGVYL